MSNTKVVGYFLIFLLFLLEIWHWPFILFIFWYFSVENTTYSWPKHGRPFILFIFWIFFSGKHYVIVAWTREAVHFVFFLNIFQWKTLRIRGLDTGGRSFWIFFEYFSVENTACSWPGLCAAENFARLPCTMKYCPAPKSVTGKEET